VPGDFLGVRHFFGNSTDSSRSASRAAHPAEPDWSGF